MNPSSRPTTSLETVRVRIYRFDPATDEAPRYESYEVPRTPRMRVMDVLDYVHETLAEDIAYRWFCGAKRCGTCGVTVNGTPALACWEEAQPEMTIEPLKNLPVVRDLVTEREPYERILAKLSPLLARAGDYAGFPEPLTAGDMEPGSALRDCVQCLVCHAACPVIELGDTDFAGPTALVALAELALDPRDGLDRGRIAAEEAAVFQCVSCYKCQEVCPAEIPVVSAAIEPLKARAYQSMPEKAVHARAFMEIIEERGRIDPGKLILKTRGLGALARPGQSLRLLFRGKINPKRTFFGKARKGAADVRKLFARTRNWQP